MNRSRAFPPELRTASVVPRWSVVWTLTRDTVSNHSFFVTFYTREIARLIGWRGDMADLMYRALTHDLDETITGDVVSPVKEEIIDDKRAAAYIDRMMEERLPFVARDLDEMARGGKTPLAWMTEDEEAWLIVKAADKLDALIFLLGETRLGNGVIAPHMPRARNKFEGAWRALPAPKDQLDELWNTVMMPVIREHEINGGWGV